MPHAAREWLSLVTSRAAAGAVVRRHCRVTHPYVTGLAASITMLCPNTSGLADPAFLLEFQSDVPGAAREARDGAVSQLQQLTAAEHTVATVLADGLSNQEIADALGKTVAAVKFLLHRIHQKTGIPNRSALVAVMRARPGSRGTGNDGTKQAVE